MKNKLTPEDKKILKLLGYVKTEEDGAQFEHPDICDHVTFPQYVWKGDTLADVLKNFTAGIEYATMQSIQGDIQRQMNDLKHKTKYE
jgi:hypothetical protein